MNRSDDVAIFWDYENCPVPYNASGCAIANSITSLSRPFGSVKLFRAYLEIADQLPLSRSVGLRSELQSSGVSLIDCPHNGRKEVADKMIIVDMLAFAIDNPAPCTIVVISGDRDYAYALSVLKLRCYRMILVTLPNAHTTLTAQASLCFDWSASVLNAPATPNNAVHPGPSSRYPVWHSHSQQSSLEPLSPPEYVRRPPNPLPSTSPVESDESPNIPNFLQNRPHQRLSISQAFPTGRSSSQPRAPERDNDNNVTVPTSESSRPPIAAPAASCLAGSASVVNDPSMVEESELPPNSGREGPSGTAPSAMLSTGTAIPNENMGLPDHDSTPLSPIGRPPIEAPSAHADQLVDEVGDPCLTGTAEAEDFGAESSSGSAPFVERQASAPSTLLQSLTTPDVAPVWLNGAQWELDTATDEDAVPSDIHSTTSPLQEAPPISPVKPRVIRSAGLPAFSFAAMARLQAVDLNKADDLPMPLTKTIEITEPIRSSNLISGTTIAPVSPSSTARYLTAPQTPQEKTAPLPDPDRTACPSPTSSAFPLLQSREIPSEFVTLVQCLQMRIAHGHFRPLVTEVALESAGVWAASRITGSVGFGQNVNLAVKAGIIEMGGTERQPWISLKPEWHDAEPALESPDASNTPTSSSSSSNQNPLWEGSIEDDDGLSEEVARLDPAEKNSSSTQSNATTSLEPFIAERDAEAPTSTHEQDFATVASKDIALPSPGIQAPMNLILPSIQTPEQSKPAVSELGIMISDNYNGGMANCQLGTTATGPLSNSEPSQMAAPALFSTIVSTGASKSATEPNGGTVLKPMPSTSTSASPTNRPIIPRPFGILVQTLQELRNENTHWPLRSDVALLISKNEDSDTCSQAGVEDFHQYLDLAEKQGIVVLGGKEGNEWVGLCRKWYDAVPGPTQDTKADRKVEIPLSLPSILPSSIQVALSGENTTRNGAVSSATPGPSRAPVPIHWTPQFPALGGAALSNPGHTPHCYPPHPTFQASSSSQPAPRQPAPPQPVIPIANFMLIVQTLREYQSKGNARPSRSAVAGKIGNQVHKTLTGEAYKRAGIQTFKQYLEWAVKLGIIEIGGVERDAWISLHPQWSTALPSVKNHPPPAKTGTILPGDFVILVKVLQALRLEGNWGPLWFQVAPHIAVSGIYEKTGIKTLDEYVELAVRQGIVDVGGEGGTRWMRLLPHWHLRVTS